MATHYIKNFDRLKFQEIADKMQNCADTTNTAWHGTVFIGTKPVFIKSDVKWLCDLIERYFVKTIPNKHVSKAKELYILYGNPRQYIDTPTVFNTNIYFLSNNIYKTPDLIVHDNCILLCNGDKIYLSVDENAENNFYHLGESHLLMRLFYYLFDDENYAVLHGAVVGINGRGVLISGLSGSGKSTLSGLCLSMGADFIGDDRIAIERVNDKTFAYPIYSTISLYDTIDGIKIIDSNSSKSKTVSVLDKLQISDKIQIIAVIEPQKNDAKKLIISPIPRAGILTRICQDYAYYSLLARSTNVMGDYQKISRLLKNIDCYKIDLSDSVVDNARAILDFVKTIG